jgi:DNA-binding transcriptional ArsR family regulator
MSSACFCSGGQDCEVVDMRTPLPEATRLVPDIISLTTSAQLDDEQRAALLAKRLEALSHPTRLQVLRVLAASSESKIGVNALVRLIGVATQGTVSRHIQTLVLAGFLQCEEAREARGIYHYYSVRRQAIAEALEELLSYTRIAEANAATG